ncbi:hypothetical protein [Lysobacter sp. CFH 32150]|uniref:hypothetical protein n=1 Tax=Lysobacter sp. CFH 32150 TaxID=2927128 RepID=UPI001FA801B9|nr:hypothetical protein [Lysobacter sp. CFH 32150]MCI4568055.1 hypothetical protein [Lysobacter sp. CFH 32150]
MPSTNANLDVRNFPSNGSDGYTNTTASNNAVYSYMYSGGNDGAGGMEVRVNSGTATLNLSLDDDNNRYSIDAVSFLDDTGNQLTWRGNAPANGVITDANTVEETAHYKVRVADTTAGCTFQCDPVISNERDPPKGLIRHTH